MHSSRTVPDRPAPRFSDAAPRRPRRRWPALVLLITVVAFAGLLLFTKFDWSDVTRTIDRLDPVTAVLAMAVLPLAGVSISVVYLVAGARFGPVWGGAVVTAVTAFHLLASHVIARGFFRAPLERWFARRQHHRLPVIPPEDRASVALMVALVPGLPYFARNYLLALSGIPLRIYFWICLPLYVARSYVAILVGDLGTDWSRPAFLVLLAVYAVKLSICAWVLWRLRRRHPHLFRPAKNQDKSG